MSQYITVDGHCYTVEDSDNGAEHVITVWAEGISVQVCDVNRLVCDIEIFHNTESAQVIYRDGEGHAVNYWEYVENVEKLGLRDADIELARWAVCVEE